MQNKVFTVRTNHDSSGNYLILERWFESYESIPRLHFIIATQVGAAQARGRAQKVAWRPFRPAIDFFLSFEQSGLRNRGKWRLGRIMICPNRGKMLFSTGTVGKVPYPAYPGYTPGLFHTGVRVGIVGMTVENTWSSRYGKVSKSRNTGVSLVS